MNMGSPMSATSVSILITPYAVQNDIYYEFSELSQYRRVSVGSEK